MVVEGDGRSAQVAHDLLWLEAVKASIADEFACSVGGHVAVQAIWARKQVEGWSRLRRRHCDW